MLKPSYILLRTTDQLNTHCLAYLFDSFLVCPHPILVLCCLLPGEINLTSSCHRDSKAAKFYSPVCSPMGEADKNAETG
jgi:hypothetical protein